MSQKVTKAVIAAAGFGTRFLPQTKAMPKEMLPLVDKPIIQYVVEELVNAGIKDIIIVGSSNKRSIEDHFDSPKEDLMNNLRAGGAKKKHYIDEIERLGDMANFIYVRQKGPYGNATPVLNAEHLIGDEPFIYTFADDFFVAEPGRTVQMINVFKKYGGCVLACKRCSDDRDYDRYGIAGGKEIAKGVLEVDKIVEKPGKAKAPSNLASVSGYLVTPNVFEYLRAERDNPKRDGELNIQPAMQSMIEDGLPIHASEIDGVYHDTGDKLEYVKTVVDFALGRDDLKEELSNYLRQKLCD